MRYFDTSQATSSPSAFWVAPRTDHPAGVFFCHRMTRQLACDTLKSDCGPCLDPTGDRANEAGITASCSDNPTCREGTCGIGHQAGPPRGVALTPKRAGTSGSGGLSTLPDARHETFWFRGHGIEGFTHVEKNHDPRHHHDQSGGLPHRYRRHPESVALTLEALGSRRGLLAFRHPQHSGRFAGGQYYFSKLENSAGQLFSVMENTDHQHGTDPRPTARERQGDG